MASVLPYCVVQAWNRSMAMVLASVILSWEKRQIWGGDLVLPPLLETAGEVTGLSQSPGLTLLQCWLTGNFMFSSGCCFSGTDLYAEGQWAETRNKASFLHSWLIAQWDRSECSLNRWTSISELNTPILPWAASFHSSCVINLLQNKTSQVKQILMARKCATGVGISLHPGSEIVPSS